MAQLFSLGHFTRYELSEMQFSDGEGMAGNLRATSNHTFSLAARQARLGEIRDAEGFGARHQTESLGTWLSRRIYLQDVQDYSFFL